MAKKVTFKNPTDMINFGGRIIGPHNINEEVYNQLVAAAPAHANFFNVEEVKDTTKPPDKA